MEWKSLEVYFTTENEHWNEFAFKMACEALQEPGFTRRELLLEMYSRAIGLFGEYENEPCKAIDTFDEELNQKGLNPQEQLFIYKWVVKYVEKSEFDYDCQKLESLLRSHYKRRKQEEEKKSNSLENLREVIKEHVQREMEGLTQTLKEMQPDKRLNIICKLLPYVLKTQDAVECEGEWRLPI